MRKNITGANSAEKILGAIVLRIMFCFGFFEVDGGAGGEVCLTHLNHRINSKPSAHLDAQRRLGRAIR